MTTLKKIQFEQVSSLLKETNNRTVTQLAQFVMEQYACLHQLADSMEQKKESQESFTLSQEMRPFEEMQAYSEECNQVQLSEDYKFRIENINCFGSLQRNRDKLFKRYRSNQEKEQSAKVTGNYRGVERKQQFYESLGSDSVKLATQQTQKDKKVMRKITKKQINFKSNCNKIEKLLFLGEDVQKLNPGGDLNDNIIENYIKILKNYAFPYCLSERIHIFSTFFFTKLLANSLDILEGQTQRDLERLRKKVYENYGNIKRWTKNTDIFEKNLLVFPINAFNHWFCIIVSHPGSLSLGKQVSESPCEIIYCDSMLQKKQFVIQVIKEYLCLEHFEKKRADIRPYQQNLNSYQLLLPRQLNTHDCGLYMITYIDEILGKPQILRNLRIVQNRNKLQLFPRKLIFTMRQRLIKLIQNLSTSNYEDRNSDILKEFFRQKQQIIEKGNDFEQIDQQQFTKYKKLNIFLAKEMTLPTQELQHSLLIRFYLDSEINHYEKDNKID